MQQQPRAAQAGLGNGAKAVLNHSELHFQRLLEHLPAGAYTCDREGRITYCNRQAVQLWGRTPKLHDPAERFCGSLRLFSPTGSPMAHDQCSMALALRMNQAFHGHETVIERPDGQRITVLAHANPIHDESGNLLGAVNVLVDISDRQRVEEARAAEARFLQAQNDVAAVALSSLHPEMLMPRLLEAICRAQQYMYGLLWRVVEEDRAMVVVATFGEGTRPFLGCRQELHLPDCFIAQVARTGQAALCNHMQQAAFGRHPMTHILGGQASLGIPLLGRTGVVLGMLDFMDTQCPDRFSALDVEQGTILAHQVVQVIENSDLFGQLQQLQARDKAVTDTMHEAVYVVNLEGRIVFANPALARLSHYSLQDLLGQPSTMLYPPAVTPGILRRRRAHLQGTDRVPYRQLTMIRKDGQHIDIEVSTAGLAVDGRVEGFVVVIRDITERLQLETQLRQSQKMQALGTLVGGIAHDFNNLLGVVLGYADLTLQAVPQESMAWNHLKQILVAGERARHLVQQMLTFSRQAKQERQPLQLHLLVKEVLELLRAVFPATITLRQEIDLQTSTVLADPIQMQQVLMNLCTNAAHAMRQTGGGYWKSAWTLWCLPPRPRSPIRLSEPDLISA